MLFTWELVQLDGVIDRSGREASGVGADRQGRDAVPVVAEDPRRAGREQGVMNRDRRVGGGGGDEVVSLLVPQHGAQGRAAVASAAAGGGLVSLPELQRSDFHGGFAKSLRREF